MSITFRIYLFSNLLSEGVDYYYYYYYYCYYHHHCHRVTTQLQ